MAVKPVVAGTASPEQPNTAEVWGGWIGVAGMLLAAAAGGVEALLSRPWPTGPAQQLTEFLADNRVLLLAQSLLFVAGAAASVWFLGVIRARLVEAEGAPGTLSGVAFGAGLITYGMIVLGQAAQITVALPAMASVSADVTFAVEGLATTTTALANVPAVLFFAAVAVLSFTRHAFPRWLGWVAVLCALTSVLSGLTVVAADGPLATAGWLTGLARVVPVLFYLPVAVLLISGRGRIP